MPFAKNQIYDSRMLKYVLTLATQHESLHSDFPHAQPTSPKLHLQHEPIAVPPRWSLLLKSTTCFPAPDEPPLAASVFGNSLARNSANINLYNY
ncbi:hypothetical protein T4C_12707 [Trichinella pseudospiralis]|uniref:Uncharacterized protein n=1 Tax=Trichinella pseudospiralis TaxID=6337 RepID=A0A0V1IXU8_TRIPS|nr:hypothetical protein T4C_12707 [Trichinella pseudospiralis]